MFRHLGLALRLLRELRGQSQAQTARQSGIGKSQLSKYENGRDLPKLDSLEKVLTAIGVGHEGFFSTLATIDRWAAGSGAFGEPETPKLASTGVERVDHAFGVALYHLAAVHRAFLEALLLPSLPEALTTDGLPGASSGGAGSVLRDPCQEPAASSSTAAG